jgi:hypothetical protein
VLVRSQNKSEHSRENPVSRAPTSPAQFGDAPYLALIEPGRDESGNAGYL